MDLDLLYLEIDEKMEKTVKATAHELAMVRTGRASTALLDRIVVEAYGVQMPINQVATLNIGDATTILIRPFDKGNLGAIEKAIQKSDLGLTPHSDGTLLRLNIPALTKERRQELVKMTKQMVEDGKVALRNIRRENVDKVRKDEKSGHLSEDLAHDAQEKIQELTDSAIEEMEKIFKKKEEEILTV